MSTGEDDLENVDDVPPWGYGKTNDQGMHSKIHDFILFLWLGLSEKSFYF